MNNSSKLIKVLIMLIAFLSFINVALAEVVVFDNGSLGSSTTRCISGPSNCGGSWNWSVYDNFSLTSATTVSGFANWNDFGVASDYSSTTWSVWSATPSNGGSPLFSGNSIATISNDMGFMYASVSGLSLDLAAGTYWLGISHQLTSSTPWTYVSALGATSDAIQLDGANSTYTGLSGMAFNVVGVVSPVPEPETYAMLLAGLGLVGFQLRRKSKQSSSSMIGMA